MNNSKVIDADGHIIERSEEPRRYLKPPFDKRRGPLTASEPWDRDLQRTLPANQELYPRGSRAEDWLRVMDAYSIEKAFLYPTSMGNVSRVREPDYAVAFCEAYNDYVRDHYAKVSPRLSPIALIPFQDPERAVIELRRAVKELGYRAAVVRNRIAHTSRAPILRSDLPGSRGTGLRRRRARNQRRRGACVRLVRDIYRGPHTVSFPVGIFVQFSNVIFQGVPERFPKLRLAFLEIGCTWLPYWLDRMDEHWEKRGKIETPLLKQRPSACVRERPIYFSLEAEEKLLPETFRYVGDEHFVYATDIPHWDTKFPENLHRVQSRKDLSDETKNKLLYENAKALYQI